MIAGPTASGKTALAIALARRTGAEIVSADSQQLYAHFDVGTAKPTAAELAAAPHHLISVVDPREQCTAARYQRLADEAIAAIQRRGRGVIVVGGTGLYLRALLRGVMDAPAADPQLRRRLEEEAAQHGRAALHARLQGVDPQSAAQIHPSDLVRVIRALEIHARTGEKASARRRRHGFSQLRHPHRLLVLAPDRAKLYARIDARTRALFDGGLVEEVQALVARGYRDAVPMRSVGYAQALAHHEGQLTRDEAIALAAQQTRRYAKRQLTWFQKEPGAEFFRDADDLEAAAAGPGPRR